MHAVTARPRLAHALALAMLCGLSAPLAAPAADLGPTGFVGLLPVAELEGGASTELYVVALDPDGTPVTGATLKTVRTAGLAKTWTEVGGGVYKIAFSAPVVLTPSALPITVRGKSPRSGAKLTLDTPVELIPARPAATIASNLDAMLLGRDPEATLTVTGTSSAGIKVRTSAGTVASIDVLPAGGAAARFDPPKLNYPHSAIVTFADAADPFGRGGFVVVKLNGNAEYPVKAPPGASVSLDVAGRTFGPVVADASGKARVPVEVPPGVFTATQIDVVNGQESRSSLDLRIPETRRIELFPLPGELPAGPDTVIQVKLAVVTPAGAPDVAATPVFEPSGGATGPVTPLGGGVYAVDWRLPDAAGAASIKATLGSETQTDAVEVNLVPRRPAKIELTSTVGAVDAAGQPFEVVAKLSDAAGGPIVGAAPTLAVTGADKTAGPVDRGNGDYGFTVDPPDEGDADVQLEVAVTGGATRNPVAHLAVAPARTQLPNDGTSATEVTVMATDAAGAPVEGAAVTLDVRGVGHFGASNTIALTTGPDGTAHATYTVGASLGVVGLHAVSGPASGVGALLLLPADVPAVALPTGAAMAGAPAQLTVPRGGADAGGAAVASAWTTGPSIRLTSAATSAAPGATITVVASALDAAGAVDKGLVVALTTVGAATIGAGTVGEDGAVSFPVTFAADAAGPIELVATAAPPAPPAPAPAPAPQPAPPEGTPAPASGTPEAATPAPEPAAAPAPVMRQVLTVVVERPEDPWAGGSVAATPAPMPVAAAPVPVAVNDVPRPPPNEPKEAGDYRWFRGRLSGIGSTYRYAQVPSASPGPLLTAALRVGGPDGGSAATPVGGEVDLRAWGDAIDAPYLGLHARARFASYGIASTAFDGVARDVLNNVDVEFAGRLPFDLLTGGDRYWVGAKLGFAYSDFLLFTGCLDQGCVVAYEPIGVAGLGFGPEFGVELDAFHLIGGYTVGLASGSEPYSNAFDVEAGYEVVERVYVDLGVGVTSRTVVLQGADSGLARGQLTDSQMMAKLGVGFAL